MHQGFGIAEAVIRKAAAALPGVPAPRVVVTGHSLGAAVATVAAAHLRRRGIACDLYAYGSPCVGNAAFAALFDDRRLGFTARITNACNIVTVVPVRGLPLLHPYAHVAPEYWYQDGLDGTAAQYGRGRRRVCRSEDECGSAACLGWLPWCSIPDHQCYGGPFNPCGPSGRRGKSLDPVLPEMDKILRKILLGSNETLRGSRPRRAHRVELRPGEHGACIILTFSSTSLPYIIFNIFLLL